MANLVRDNLGYIDLEELGCTYDKGTVVIDGERYYFKDSGLGAFKELVVDELALDFGIKCAEYDLASFSYRCGLISRDLNRGNLQFEPMSTFLSKFYHTTDYRTLRTYNNLDDIGMMLQSRFDYPTYKRLMEQLDRLFLFDLMVGNTDRNCTNYGIQYDKGSLDIVIFDSEQSLDTSVFYMDEYQLRRRRGHNDDLSDLSYSDIKESLKLISDENIDSVFERVERKIQAPINEGIKSNFRTFFRTSRTVIGNRVHKQSVKRVEM